MKRVIMATVVILLTIAAVLTVILPAYVVPNELGHDPYDDQAEGCSILRERLDDDFDSSTIVTDLIALNDLDNPKETILILVGGGSVPSSTEVDAFHAFIDSGGKAIVFSEGSSLNVISEKYGIRFYGHTLLDDNFTQAGPSNASVFDVGFRTAAGLHPMRLNQPTALEIETNTDDVTPIALSSENSSLDLDENGLRSIGDKVGPLTVAAVYDPSWRDFPERITSHRDLKDEDMDRVAKSGRIIFIADVGAATNQMCQATENGNATIKLIQNLMLPLRFNGSYDLDDVEASWERKDPAITIMFDSSRVVKTGPQTLLSNLLTVAVYLGNLPQAWGILALNLIGLTILWWVTTKRPQSFTAKDRLDDFIERTEIDADEEEEDSVNRLRSLLIGKLGESPKLPKKMSSLIYEDLVEQLPSLESEKLERMVGDTDLVTLIKQPDSFTSKDSDKLANKILELDVTKK